jgi:hypothetical protein
MKKVTSVALGAFFATTISSASAQILLQHFSQTTIDKVAARFSKSLKDGGMTEVASDIQSCYEATSFKRTRENSEAIAACMLYDYAALDFDKGMRTNFVARGLNDPGNVLPYLSEQALVARFQVYAPIPFGNDPSAVGTYFADAPSKVLNKLTF